MNELSKKWMKTGLLEELYTDSQFDFVSQKLEEVVNALYDSAPDERLSGLVLPSMRRIYDSLSESEMPDGKWLVDDMRKFFIEKRKSYDDLIESSYIAMDAEAEFTMFYCDDVVKRLKKR